MLAPVDRSITVSAPQRVAHCSFSTSSWIDDEMAELPMLALIFTRKLRPMIIGSSSGWRMLAGMMARPAGHLVAHELRRDVLAQGHEAHLLGDLAPAGVVHLGEVPVAAGHAPLDPGLRAAWAARAARRAPAARWCRRPAPAGCRRRRRSRAPAPAARPSDTNTLRDAGRSSSIGGSVARPAARRRPACARPRRPATTVNPRRRAAPLPIAAARPSASPFAGITRIRFVGSRRA